MICKKSILTIIFGIILLFAQNVSAQTSPKRTQTSTTPPVDVQVSNVGEPQGNTLEAQIARGEFYKAQYPNDPATQAKYQQAIDALKSELAQQKSAKKD